MFTEHLLFGRIMESPRIGLLHSHAGRLFLALQQVGFVRPEHLPQITPGALPQVEKYLDGRHTEYSSTETANRTSHRVEGHICAGDDESVTLTVRWYGAGEKDPMMMVEFVILFTDHVVIRHIRHIGMP